MALDERYVIASDLQQYFVDKDSGLPLSGGTLTFYKDEARNEAKAVYELSGTPPDYTYTSLGAQVTLSAVGTAQDSSGNDIVIYYYPYDSEGNLELYYVVCRDSNGIEQFTREAWPNITTANDPTKADANYQNQISNPTFTNIFLNDGLATTFTVSSATNQVFSLAPNWDFVISGTGTVVVQQIAVTGNDNIPTSPPYMLDVQVSAGVTSCFLRQRFSYNSGLWASTSNQDIFLSGALVARNEGIGNSGIQMYYAESTGGSPILIVDGSFSTTYTLVNGSSADAIPASTNTDSGKNGYVDIYLSFNTLSHIRVSNIQVVPTQSGSANITAADIDSSNRNEALQGDYYLPRAAAKQIPSFLVGWDFSVAPFQFGASGNIGTTAAYIADQTIALRGSSGNVAYANNSAIGSIVFTTAGTNDSWYMMQYLDSDQVRNMIGTRLSVNVFGYQNDTASPVTMRVYLFRAPSTASFPSLPTSIGTVATNGVFTLTAAGWTEIPRSGLDTATATLNQLVTSSNLGDGDNDYGFSGWEITDATQINDTDKFAIVVTFAYVNTSSVVAIKSISVVPGDLPCRPAVQSADEVLRKCQYYYEKTYAQNTLPGTITTSGVRMFTVALYTSGGNDGYYIKTFDVRFYSVKRTTPTMTFYSPSSASSNTIQVAINPAGVAGNVSSSLWSSFGANIYGLVMLSVTSAQQLITPTDADNEGLIEYHYVADARLGIV